MEESGVDHWKRLYEETKAELDEFKETSLEYEKELEAELAQKEGQYKDERRARERAERELEQTREKLAGVSAAASGQIAELQEALHSIMGDMETKARQLQALEQSHDMLEQAERRAGSTLQDTEAKLEAVIERNAFLEFENNNLEGELQHLREELRDCQNELAVLHNRPAPPSPKRSVRNREAPPPLQKAAPAPAPASAVAAAPTPALPPATKMFNMNDIMARVQDLEKKILETRTSIWALGNRDKDEGATAEAGSAAPKPFNEAAADFFKNSGTFFKKMGSLSTSPKDSLATPNCKKEIVDEDLRAGESSEASGQNI